jgi:hypothetical protein
MTFKRHPKALISLVKENKEGTILDSASAFMHVSNLYPACRSSKRNGHTAWEPSYNFAYISFHIYKRQLASTELNTCSFQICVFVQESQSHS